MSLSNNDLIRAWLTQELAAGVVAGTSQPVPGVSAGVKIDSVAATGRLNNPTAGGSICSIASGLLVAGYYKISLFGYMEGTPANSLDADNIEFRIGATPKFNLSVPASSVAVSTRCDAYFNLDGSSNISLNATVTATAGANYHGNIIATRQG